ncbi:MAG TPA: amidohydrolase family protein [Actinomycetota bacterium]|nr:amidohydrolase family protein [Actinomycetota bacterium]
MTSVVFHAGRLFDGTGAALAEGDVRIEDGRIVEVGTDLDGDDGIDCTGKTLLPGLFDTHVHVVSRYEDFEEIRVLHEPFSAPFFRVAENMRRTLACGITTVRDAAGADAGMRLAVEEGSLVGPRMQISVTMLSMTGDTTIRGCRAAARGRGASPIPGCRAASATGWTAWPRRSARSSAPAQT